MHTQGSIFTDSFDISIPSSAFKELTLDKFCVKRHFEIGFATGATNDDQAFLKDLIETNLNKESVTHVTFIDSKDVREMVSKVSLGDFELDFPPSLIDELKRASQFNSILYCNDVETNDEYEAYSMKFKLIQTMYEQYGNLVKEMRRQEKLNRDLEILAERKATGSRGKRSTTDIKSKQSTGNSSRSARKAPETMPVEDYTEVELKENDVVIDDRLKEQVNVYIFTGYKDINVVKHLLRINIPVSFIIRVADCESDKKTPLCSFWKSVDHVRNCVHCDFLQSVAVMKYQASLIDDSRLSSETYLKQFIETVKSIVDLKRLHFHYIKSLKHIETKFTETFRVFPVYQRIMDKYPLETTTVPLILNSMIQEVLLRSDNILKSSSFNEPKRTVSTHNTSCPFNITAHLRSKQRKKVEKDRPSFKIYENDILNLTLKSYKNIGYQYVQDNLDILKKQTSVILAQQCEFNETVDDFMEHRHDVFVPYDEEPLFTDVQSNHLINLLYLKKKMYYNKEQRISSGNEFTENLICHDEYKNHQSLIPRCTFHKSWKTSEPFIDHFPDTNVYEFLRPMALHWAEIITTDVLFQYLFDSQLKYLCCDNIQCELTNSLIVRCHNDVDSFGLNTRVWTEYLRTPIGLADFCKFTLIDDYDWLKENETYSQITYVDVVKMIEDETALRLYVDDANKHFKNILVPQIQYSSSDIRKEIQCPCIEENVCRVLETCNYSVSNQKLYSDPTFLSTNLEAIMQDLEEYKNITDLSQHCKHKNDTDYSFAAYNFGVNKFSTTGHTTNFISLDNVTVTVDSSRFYNEKSKLMVKLTSDDFSFVLHSPQKQFKCHVTLSDGTIVAFAKPTTEQQESENDEDLADSKEQESTMSSMGMDEGVVLVEKKSSVESEVSDQTAHFEFGDQEQTISSIDFNHYSSLELYPIVGNMIRETPRELHKTNLKKEMDILKRLQNYPECLKVSQSPSKNYQYLSKKLPENGIAMSSVVRRIINNPEKQLNCQQPKRKCVIKGDLPPKENNSPFDCIATVPNGLTIKLLPSEILPNSFVIKQSYEHASNPREVYEERYRMFTSDGTIIIGKMDGTITLLMSSGKEIRFEKPTNTTENHRFCRLEKKLDEHMVRNLFTRLMSSHTEYPASEYYISRRGHLNSRSTSVASCESLSEMAKIPFSTVSMITFEGEKITLKNKKLIKVVHSRHTCDINFQTEERFFKREDGFTSNIDREGTHYVEFPDGTSIRTVVQIEDEPFRLNKKDSMGWMIITATFFYEHPFYKPVFFDNINLNIDVRMNEDDFLNITPSGAFLNLKGSCTLDIKTDFIIFKKECGKCGSTYKCKLHVDPLYHNRKHFKKENIFVTVKDSYKKNFKADFTGKCQVLPTYISGAANRNGCNHFSMTDYQKIFLIKNDLSGMILWNDKTVSNIMKNSEDDRNINHFNDVRNTLVFLTITKNIYNKFEERFFGKLLKDIDEYDSDPSSDNRPVIYQKTRNLYSMFELDQIEGLLKCLKKFFQEETMKELALSLSTLKFHLKTSKFSVRSLSQIYNDDGKLDSKPVISLHEKLVELSKKDAQVKRIFKMAIPNYFNSKVCTYVDMGSMYPTISRSSSRARSKGDILGVLQL